MFGGGVAESVGVGVAESVGVGVAESVGVGVAESVGVGVAVSVGVGVAVSVGVGVVCAGVVCAGVVCAGVVCAGVVWAGVVWAGVVGAAEVDFDAVGVARGVAVNAGPMNGILISGRFTDLAFFVALEDGRALADVLAGCDDERPGLLRVDAVAPATVREGMGAGDGLAKSNWGSASPL